MFISSIAKRFFLIFFGSLLGFIVCVNLYQMIFQPDNYYFGFRSVINAFNDFPYLTIDDPNATISIANGSIVYSLYLPQIFQNLYNHTIGVFESLGSLNSALDILKFIRGLFQILFLPVGIITDLLSLVLTILQAVASIFVWFIRILLGAYNSTMVSL